MAHVTEKNVGPQTSKSHDCITCIFLTEKNIFEKNKVYCRTTITNVHPKRPWMCFSDKYYRRKVLHTTVVCAHCFVPLKLLRDPTTTTQFISLLSLML
jgi:hypothetical protein